MTTRTEAGAEKSFVSAFLPWIVAGLLAVVYLGTLNHWLSFTNLQAVARTTGQIWTPDLYAPLFNLITSPFRWLPEAWVPLALNFFAAVCAFFVLLLLVRCVVLMPQDRTQKQRERETSSKGLLSIPLAWIPPVLAALVLGLQLTFWENATTLSQGMFDLVLFAYAVRCLLEFRVSARESWLLRAAVVYAAGCTDTWVMIALAPFFLGAIVWMKGFGFFDLRFLARLFLCGLAGLAFYLYLPLLHLRIDGFFWDALKTNVAAELYLVKYVFVYTPRHAQFLLLLTSILPIILIGIRWGSSFGDTSEIGVMVATWIFHLVSFVLLAVCIWAAFDTSFGLRDPAGKFQILDLNRDKLLPLYFLGALSIGYLSGYFLLVFRPVQRRNRRASASDKFFLPVSTAVICLILVLAPLGLLVKNVPPMRAENGPTFRNYGSMMGEKLPPQGVVVSDSSGALLVARQWMARQGKAENYLFLDTGLLRYAGYYQFQTRRHPEMWPAAFTNVNPNTIVNDGALLRLMRELSQKHPIYYLHPSFGYYFEKFYTIPHGLVQELQPYPTNNAAISPPPLSEAVFAENEAFWKEHAPEVQNLVDLVTPPSAAKPGLRQRWLDEMHIPIEKNFDAIQLGSVYSRALNVWGVDAQRMGRLDAAGAHFNLALELSPENVVARANADFNSKLRKGERVAVDNPTAFEDRFGKFNTWENTLNANGVFDEPTGCLAEGIVFARGRLERQAAQCFLRTLALAPESLLARLWLARVYLPLDLPDKALPLIDELRTHADGWNDAAINSNDVFQVELAANYVAHKPDRVQHLLRTALAHNPPDSALLDTASRVCVSYGDFASVVPLLDKQLQLNPTNIVRLIDKAFAEMQLTNFNEALVPLAKALSLQATNTAALYCRGICYLETDKLDESQKDFETLQKLQPNNFPAYHGMGEIAFRRKDTNNAIRYFELDLSNAPPNSSEVIYARDRLKTLKNGAP